MTNVSNGGAPPGGGGQRAGADHVPGAGTVSAHHYLRTATQSAHDSAEAVMGLDRPISAHDLRGALSLFVTVFEPVEQALRAWQSSHPGTWTVESRSHLARADLDRGFIDARGGQTEPEARWIVTVPGHGFGGSAEALGFAYALEGSRLGAASVAKMIATDLPGAASSFFGVADLGRWRRFTEHLEHGLVDRSRRERAAAAAQSVFAAFVLHAPRSRLD